LYELRYDWFSWFYTVDLFFDLELLYRGKSKELFGTSLVIVAVTTGCEDWLRDKMIDKAKYIKSALLILLSLLYYMII